MMYRGFKRKMVGALVVVVIVALFGGCGNASTEGKTSSENGSGQEILKNNGGEQLSIDDLAEGEKYQITLGCIPTIMPQVLEAAIVDFNKSNPHYEVIVKEYDWQEGQQRLEMDLATGRGPDIFDLSMVYVDALVDKGLLTDLGAYLSDGQGMEREDLVETVLECNTKEGVLTCIPPRFTLDVLVGKQSVIGERSEWSVEEFLECVEENEGMQVAKSNYKPYSSELQNRYSIVDTAIYRGLEYLVDTEAGEVRFAEEEFAELLTFAKNYEAAPFDYEADTGWFQSLVQQEELLLCRSGITKVSNYMVIKAILGEETQFIGFPTYDGSSGYGIRNFISYGINENSQVKDGAWAFLEYLITYRLAGSQVDEYGFYTSKSMLAEQFADGMEKEYIQGVDGERIEKEKLIVNGGIKVYAATEEDIDRLCALIDAAGYVYGMDSNSIYQIVQEETYNYLGETQNVEAAVSLIQNRVQLYLDEMN